MTYPPQPPSQPLPLPVGAPPPTTGDLLFFHSTGRWYERLIVWWTSGGNPRADFVHVEIMVSASASVGALTAGITRHPAYLSHGAVLVRTSVLLPDRARLRDMTLWLAKERGQGYGWGNILDAGLRRLWPGGWRVSRRGRYDCSVLAARALWIAGYPLPPSALDSLDSLSPNDLAHLVGAC